MLLIHTLLTQVITAADAEGFTNEIVQCLKIDGKETSELKQLSEKFAALELSDDQKQLLKTRLCNVMSNVAWGEHHKKGDLIKNLYSWFDVLAKHIAVSDENFGELVGRVFSFWKGDYRGYSLIAFSNLASRTFDVFTDIPEAEEKVFAKHVDELGNRWQNCIRGAHDILTILEKLHKYNRLSEGDDIIAQATSNVEALQDLGKNVYQMKIHDQGSIFSAHLELYLTSAEHWEKVLKLAPSLLLEGLHHRIAYERIEGQYTRNNIADDAKVFDALMRASLQVSATR